MNELGITPPARKPTGCNYCDRGMILVCLDADIHYTSEREFCCFELQSGVACNCGAGTAMLTRKNPPMTFAAAVNAGLVTGWQARSIPIRERRYYLTCGGPDRIPSPAELRELGSMSWVELMKKLMKKKSIAPEKASK